VERVLDPARIEAFTEREIARVRLPERGRAFSRRAARLRHLSASERAGEGRAIGDYLRLMAVLADAQQSALATSAAVRPSAEASRLASTHGMPPIHAVGLTREASWRGILGELCSSVLDSGDFPAAVRDLCLRLQHTPVAHLEAQADALLAGRVAEVDAAAGPFLMSALQVCWLDLAAQFTAEEVKPLEVTGVCPLCGSLPVASVVRVDKGSCGHRYLHCALCATEWHMVRVTCSHCQETKDLVYHSIEGGSPAVRAESCGSCRGYRKIFYQEKDPGIEAVADDLASLALDVLMTMEGYHRVSGNPLLSLKLAAP
jgi:FdhE protein